MRYDAMHDVMRCFSDDVSAVDVIISRHTFIHHISQARQFPLIDFIDTPGLADGRLQYPYAVNGMDTWNVCVRVCKRVVCGHRTAT